MLSEASVTKNWCVTKPQAETGLTVGEITATETSGTNISAKISHCFLIAFHEEAFGY
jgi:hypothetical protein